MSTSFNKKNDKEKYLNELAKMELKNIERKKLLEEEKIKETFNKETGFIYIIKNDALKDNLFKVGYTTKSVNERIADEYEKLRSTFFPAKLVPLAQFPVTNPVEAEKAVHKALLNYKYQDSPREWFLINYNKLHETVLKVLKPYQLPFEGKSYVVRISFFEHVVRIDKQINKQIMMNHYHALGMESTRNLSKEDIKRIMKEIDAATLNLNHFINIVYPWKEYELYKNSINKLLSALFESKYEVVALVTYPHKKKKNANVKKNIFNFSNFAKKIFS